MVVPDAGRRVVPGQAAAVHVVAGDRVPGVRPLARGVPAALAARGARHAVVRRRPRHAAVDAPGRPLRRMGVAVRAAVHLAVEAGADRSAGHLLHHAGQLWPPAPCAARARLEVVGGRLGGSGPGHDHQGRRDPRAADAVARGVRVDARLAGAPPCQELALLARSRGIPCRVRGVAGADADGRAGRRSWIPRLRRGHPVPADGHAVRRRVAPRSAALVLPAGDGDDVAAGAARVAVGDPGVAQAPATVRSALPPAAGVVGARAAVLHPVVGQARHVHPPGAADGVPGARSLVAGHRAQAWRACARRFVRSLARSGVPGHGIGDVAGRPGVRTAARRAAGPGAGRRTTGDVRPRGGRVGRRSAGLGAVAARRRRNARLPRGYLGAVRPRRRADLEPVGVLARVDDGRGCRDRPGCRARPGRLA